MSSHCAVFGHNQISSFQFRLIYAFLKKNIIQEQFYVHLVSFTEFCYGLVLVCELKMVCLNTVMTKCLQSPYIIKLNKTITLP